MELILAQLLPYIAAVFTALIAALGVAYKIKSGEAAQLKTDKEIEQKNVAVLESVIATKVKQEKLQEKFDEIEQSVVTKPASDVHQRMQHFTRDSGGDGTKL